MKNNYFERALEDAVIERDVENKKNSVEKKTFNFDEFVESRFIWKKRINEMAYKFKDVKDLAELHILLFVGKADANDERIIILDRLAALQTQHKKDREQAMLELKAGNFVYKTSEEFKIALESKTNTKSFEIQAYNNQVEFLTTTLSTLDNMIYSLKTRTTLLEYLR